jgi:hypothetical protein
MWLWKESMDGFEKVKGTNFLFFALWGLGEVRKTWH